MSRGRHQKWICKYCKAEFSVQGEPPRLCCYCSSESIAKAPSYELAVNFDEKRAELENVCKELNPIFEKYVKLKSQYDSIMSYWKQQKQRGYISKEEYDKLAMMYCGAKQNDR